MAYEQDLQPIFGELHTDFKIFGIPAMTLLGIVGACFAGFLLAYALGAVTTTVERPLTSSEVSEFVASAKADQKVLQQVEAQREALGVEGYAALSLTAEQQEALDRCAKDGIFVDSTEAELAQLAPATVPEVKEAIPGLPRYVVLIGLPAIIGCALFMQINRTSLYREMTRMLAYRRSQKKYRNLPITHMERETGKGYWEAVLEDDMQEGARS